MNFDFIELPKYVRKWINFLSGHHAKENTFTNKERWLLGRTDAQMWLYAKADPVFNCPIMRLCTIDKNMCGSGECWEAFKEWANTPIGKAEIL